MFKKVIAATDATAFCDPVVLTAAHISKQNDAKLYILHVLESASPVYRHFVKHYKTGEEIISNADYEETIKEEIYKNYADVLKPFRNYEIRVTPGFPWARTLKLARKEKVDLIVLGPHTVRAEQKGVVRVSAGVGSTVEGVIMHERCPVMIVNRTIPNEVLKFKRVMVCIDFSKSCEYAFRFAIKTAQDQGSKLFIFHMAVAPHSPTYPQAELEAEVSTLKKKLEEFYQVLPKEIEHEYSVRERSQPYLEILKYAREKDVDLIVMGSHTKQKEKKWYVGSAVEQVSFRSFCPIIVVTNPTALLHYS